MATDFFLTGQVLVAREAKGFLECSSGGVGVRTYQVAGIRRFGPLTLTIYCVGGMNTADTRLYYSWRFTRTAYRSQWNPKIESYNFTPIIRGHQWRLCVRSTQLAALFSLLGDICCNYKKIKPTFRPSCAQNEGKHSRTPSILGYFS